MDQPTSTSGKEERDNLGWLASSTMPARKRRHIEGVGTTGIFELQAQLYRSQEHAKLRADGLVDPSETHPLRRPTSDPYAGRNAGVEARAARDKLQLKGTAADPNREEAVTAALEAKAKQYERLARGEVEDADERYDVDFVRKGMLDDELGDHSQMLGSSKRRGAWSDDEEEAAQRRGTLDTAAAAAWSGQDGLVSADMERERERRRWEDAEQARVAAEAEAAKVRAVHKEAIRDLSAQTMQGREQAAALRQRKEAQLAAKRERLKAAFVQKQMSRVLGSSAAAPSQQSGAGAGRTVASAADVLESAS